MPSFDTIQPQSEDEYARVNSSNISGKLFLEKKNNFRRWLIHYLLQFSCFFFPPASDAESDNSIEIATKRLPGRPRVLKTKKNRKYNYKIFFSA